MYDQRELVRKAHEGDKEAFGMLYQEIYEDLYRFALYVLKDTYEAQDVVAEAVADAYVSMKKLRQAEAFRGWIFKILSNKCKKRLGEYREKTLVLEEVHKPVETDMDRSIQVRQAFFELEAEERFIVAMKVFGGYKSHEIGRLLHKSHNTVRSRLNRALKKMEEKLR